MWLIGLGASRWPCRSLEPVVDSTNGDPRHRHINLTGGLAARAAGVSFGEMK